MAKPNFVVFGFWNRVDEEIYKQNRTKKDVAEQCRFSRKILSSYGNMSLVYFMRLCSVLHVSADYLLFGKE